MGATSLLKVTSGLCTACALDAPVRVAAKATIVAKKARPIGPAPENSLNRTSHSIGSADGDRLVGQQLVQGVTQIAHGWFRPALAVTHPLVVDPPAIQHF